MDQSATARAATIPPPGPHGGDALLIARHLGFDPASMIDLSTSLNPFAPDVAALAAGALDSLIRYPYPEAATDALAEAIGVEAERVVLTNGGSEAIALVAGLLVDGYVEEPAFSLYRRHLRTGDDPSRGNWLTNPSSPLGELAHPATTATVWDEAYWPMTTGSWTRGDDSAWRLGSLTKLWSCPGLRIGYVIAPDAASAEAVRARQPHWSVSGLAVTLVPALLSLEDLPRTARSLRDLGDELAEAARSLGYEVHHADAPWLLLPETPGLRRRLALHRVVVRDCTSYGMPGTHRIGLPRPEQLGTVVEALAAVLD